MSSERMLAPPNSTVGSTSSRMPATRRDWGLMSLLLLDLDGRWCPNGAASRTTARSTLCRSRCEGLPGQCGHADTPSSSLPPPLCHLAALVVLICLILDYNFVLPQYPCDGVRIRLLGVAREGGLSDDHLRIGRWRLARRLVLEARRPSAQRSRA